MEISAEMAPNVNHLLNTNSTPSPEQRNNLQNFILQLDEAILNTDEQILSMQNKILVMQTRRAQLIQQRRGYSSLLSPVRCLPIEIFGKIFVYATQDHPRHVLKLSAVCQLWRYAALSTPVLWSTLELGHHKSKRKMIDHVNSWIERAHSCPLSLTIKKWRDVDPTYTVLTLIANHQTKSITLDSDGHKGIIAILKALKLSNLEMLESLSLNVRFDNRKLALPNILQFGYTPKLKTLSLFIRQRVAINILPFPWQQLTSLTISFRGSPNSISLDILRACVNLEEFIMSGHDGYDDESGSNNSVTLNYLRKLHIRSFHNTFLLSLKTPSIQELAIKGFRLKYFEEDDFYDYITINGLTLLKLSIAPSQSGLIRSIPSLQSLVELTLYDNNYDDDDDEDDDEASMMYKILSSLVVNPEMDPSTIPLPRLERLETLCQATEENQRMFMEVINSRWWSDEENTRQKQGQRSLSRIKSAVLMNAHTELNMFCRDDVDVLRAQGMNIEYLFPINGMDMDYFWPDQLL
ncbi:hypothetical protein BYT27DRAFT_7197212 [Phlegmacium glaucopus]|nr:hypothetical protein BYT27DRAFT_7197212 [Phlegmacium glaucopus]